VPCLLFSSQTWFLVCAPQTYHPIQTTHVQL
jgi:hypothetical protein